jgi:NAD(P)H-flavin reductase
MALPVNECCGLGCNNCILDQQLSARRPTFHEKFNLFNQKGYQNFKLRDIKKLHWHDNVYEFKFQLICEREEPFHKDEQLIAAPISYLMLRAPRESEGSFNPVFNDFKDFLFVPDEDDKIYYRSEPQRFDKGTPELYMSRKYTPYEVNEELRTFKIIVKLEKYGKMSSHLTTLHVGSICEFKGPFEAFKYIHEEIQNYVVFTQGIRHARQCSTRFLSVYTILGISIVSAFRLVKEIIYESAQSRVLLISCFKNLNETFLREDFFKLTHFWCLKYHIFLSDSSVVPEIPPRSGEKIHQERLNEENFKKLIKELKYFDKDVTQVLISGRERFIESMKSIASSCRYGKIAEI